MKYFFSSVVVLASCLVLSIKSHATSPQFTNITDSNFEDISKEMSANFMHHSVLGAAPLGSVFGFEFGFVGAQTGSPNIDKIVKDSGGDSVANIYNGGLVGAISVPFGLTAEAVYLPKTTAGGFSAESTSLAAKLTLNKTMIVLPFNLAIRGFYSTSKLTFDQTISSVTTSITDKVTATGAQLLLSPSLPIVEPYAGVGYVQGNNELSYSGSTIFSSSFTASQSASKSPTSTQLLLGVNVHLLVLSLGAEYSNAFGTSSYAAKLAFGF